MAVKRSGLKFARKLALKHVCRPGRRSWRLIMKRVPLVKFSGCLLRHSRKVSQTRRRNKVVGYSLVEEETTIDIIEKKAGLLSNRQDCLDEIPDLSRTDEEAFDAFLKSLNKCLDFIIEFQSSMRLFRHSQKVEKETSFNMVEEKVDILSDRLDRLAQALAQSRAEEKAFLAFLESFYKCCVFIKELKACHRKRSSSSKPLDH